ncbi:MAG TPA: hypothetical protein VG826_19015 [Pirellulales bacterium]|nr:hypothetical protein [Pirellulales bacterium]
MNRFSLPGAITALLLSLTLSQAADLTKIDRKIGPEPTYQAQPKYCLLVFGRDAQHRVWLVHDGDTLYVDRNANGDLTEPAEKAKGGDDGRTFEVGELQADYRTHKRLMVQVTKFERLAHIDPEAKERWQQDANASHYLLLIDIELAGRTGEGIDGRATHVVSRDANGFLEFGDAPERAPVIHFGGPWEVMLFGRPRLTIGRTTDLVVGIGTPGLGAGTTAYVGYEGIIPKGLSPRADITFAPASADQKPIRARYDLTHRC